MRRFRRHAGAAMAGAQKTTVGTVRQNAAGRRKRAGLAAAASRVIAAASPVTTIAPSHCELCVCAASAYRLSGGPPPYAKNPDRNSRVQ